MAYAFLERDLLHTSSGGYAYLDPGVFEQLQAAGLGLYVAGFAPLVANATGYLAGRDSSLAVVHAYIRGLDTKFSDVGLWIPGSASLESELSAYIEGLSSLTIEEGQLAFTRGFIALVKSIDLYTRGHIPRDIMAEVVLEIERLGADIEVEPR